MPGTQKSQGPNIPGRYPKTQVSNAFLILFPRKLIYKVPPRLHKMPFNRSHCFHPNTYEIPGRIVTVIIEATTVHHKSLGPQPGHLKNGFLPRFPCVPRSRQAKHTEARVLTHVHVQTHAVDHCWSLLVSANESRLTICGKDADHCVSDRLTSFTRVLTLV